VKPDPAIDARLTALTAGTRAAREAARDEAERLIGLVDWAQLARRLQARRLLPLLGERIVALAGSRAPGLFVETTEQAIRECTEQDTWLELISLRLSDVLDAAGIPSLALKGPSLGKALYGGLGRRPSADIDLLVAREDLPGAIEAAGRLGYRPADQTDARAVPLLHVRLVHSTDVLPPLELHWRVHWYESHFSRDLLFRSVEAARADRPAPLAHQLASLLLFYARDGFVDLRLACDVATWWDVFGGDLEPDALGTIIENHPRLTRVLLAAVEVAGHVVGLPSAELLGRHHRPERRVRLAQRLANPDGQGSRQQLVADTWLVDWLLTPPSGRRDCIWRQLHTPGDVGSSLTSPRRHPFASASRAAQLTARYGLSLMRLALAC
jgi:Uncharacterised nucleotidyltransferase